MGNRDTNQILHHIVEKPAVFWEGFSSQAGKVLRTKCKISLVIGSIPPNSNYSNQIGVIVTLSNMGNRDTIQYG